MIVVDEAEVSAAAERLIVALRKSATDGSGLKIMARNQEQAMANVIAAAGYAMWGETPYLWDKSRPLSEIPATAFNVGDLKNFMSGSAS